MLIIYFVRVWGGALYYGIGFEPKVEFLGYLLDYSIQVCLVSGIVHCPCRCSFKFSAFSI